MQISYLPDAESHPLWPDIYRILEPAAKLGDVEVKENEDLVWVMFDGPTLYGAATTRLLPGDEVQIRCAGGTRFKDWMPLLDGIVADWGRDCGAWKATMRGRHGWARFAERFGWVALGKDEDGLTIFEKEL